MADENKPQTVRVEVAAAPGAQSPTAPDAGLEFRNMTPEQFKERLERERAAGVKEVLRDLGVEGKRDRKAAIDAIKAGQLQLSKTQQEAADAKAKADAEAARLKPLEEKLQAKDAVLKRYADAEFAKLPENVQKAVAERFGDDAQARLDGIDWMAKHGLIVAPPPSPEQKAAAEAAAKAAADEAAKNKAANPANTIAPPGPAAAQAAGQETPQQFYNRMMRETGGNWMGAGGFALQYPQVDRAAWRKQ